LRGSRGIEQHKLHTRALNIDEAETRLDVESWPMVPDLVQGSSDGMHVPGLNMSEVARKTDLAGGSIPIRAEARMLERSRSAIEAVYVAPSKIVTG
jgi:hypothetical protein